MTHKTSRCHISVELIHDDPEHVNMIATASHHECIATIPLCRTAIYIIHHICRAGQNARCTKQYTTTHTMSTVCELYAGGSSFRMSQLSSLIVFSFHCQGLYTNKQEHCRSAPASTLTCLTASLSHPNLSTRSRRMSAWPQRAAVRTPVQSSCNTIHAIYS